MKKIITLLFILISITSFSSKDINIEKIYIRGDFINLKITPYSGKKITLIQISDSDVPIIEKTINSNSISYNLYPNQVKKHNFFKRKTKVELLIPKNYNLDYIINTTNSSISIHNITGNIFIANTRGDVTTSNIVGNLNINNLYESIFVFDIVGDVNINSKNTRIRTENTTGLLNIKTTNRRVKVINADTIGDILTSNSKLYVEFNKITPTSRVVTSYHHIILKIPESHDFGFTIFGDLIKVKNKFPKTDSKKFLVLGTSNGTISINKK